MSTVYEIVGVIPDTKYNSLRGETPPMAFAPISQNPNQGPWTNVMIYSEMSPTSVAAAVRRQLASKHPDVLVELADFEQVIRDGLTSERLMAMLAGFFGALAALLAMVGLYGVISYLVAWRRNEIGIRLALGAGRRQVVGMVMREAGRLLAARIAAGTVIALIAVRAAGTLLFGLKPYDPLTLAAAAVLLAGIAGWASFLPARRASRMDPAEALRYE